MEERVGYLNLIVMWKRELVTLPLLCRGRESWLLYRNCDKEERDGCFTVIVIRKSWLLYRNCDVEGRVGCFTFIVMWKGELASLP